MLSPRKYHTGTCGEFRQHDLQFFHSTVRDYLSTASRQRYLQEAFPNLDVDDILFHLDISELSVACCSWSTTVTEFLQPECRDRLC